MSAIPSTALRASGLRPVPNVDRDTARNALRVYMSRTGMNLRQIADYASFSHFSLRQFISRARYGDGDGAFTAATLMEFMTAHPPQKLTAPGKLYETECTGAIRKMVRYVRGTEQGGGRWGILYGPAGSQKSFTLESIAAEDSDHAVYIECSPSLTPSGFLRRIATVIGAPFAYSREELLRSLLFMLRARKMPLAVLIDEAQHLHHSVDTLETIRDLGDKSRGKAGILVAGNEAVLKLFDPRRGIYFEQWRSRIEQKVVRLTGLTRDECQEIVSGEVGPLRVAVVDELVGEPVTDPETKRHYHSARRLFHAIRDFREMRERRVQGTGVREQG